MDNTRERFESHLKTNPYDTETRGVFADWLEERGFDDEVVAQRRMSTEDWVNADKWFLKFAYDATEDDHIFVTVHGVLDAARRWLQSGQDTCLSGQGFNITNRWDDEMQEEFWTHYQNHTGEIVDTLRRGEPFGCCI